MSAVQNVTVLALAETPWYLWLYVVGIGLIAVLSFVLATFFRD